MLDCFKNIRHVVNMQVRLCKLPLNFYLLNTSYLCIRHNCEILKYSTQALKLGVSCYTSSKLLLILQDFFPQKKYHVNGEHLAVSVFDTF